jgi:hypothetical protein
VATLETRVSRLEQILLLPAFVTTITNQVQPAIGAVGQVVQLFGQNFDIGTPQVTFGTVSAPIVPNSISRTGVSVVVPTLNAGTYNVAITTAGGGPIVAAQTFTVQPPAPTFATTNAIVPAAGAPGQSIVINGANFNQSNLVVSFGATAAAITASSATQITVTVPTIAAANYTISVSTSAGTASSTTPFVVT